MDRLRLVSCRLGHAFGRASGRRAQEEAHFFRGENAQDGIHQIGLADTRAAGGHHHFRAQRGDDDQILSLLQSKLTPAQIDQIAVSIREWDWTVPILVDEAGGI